MQPAYLRHLRSANARSDSDGDGDGDSDSDGDGDGDGDDDGDGDGDDDDGDGWWAIARRVVSIPVLVNLRLGVTDSTTWYPICETSQFLFW